MMIRRYPHLTYVAISIIVVFGLIQVPILQSFFTMYTRMKYAGALLAGGLFVSSFTVSIGSALLLEMMHTLTPLEIAIIAGYGSILADYLIFRTVRNSLGEEIADLFFHSGGVRVAQFLRRNHLRWLHLLVGAIIIASPLPDEMGVALLGTSHMRPYQFLFLSFLLNVAGIYLFLSTVQVL